MPDERSAFCRSSHTAPRLLGAGEKNRQSRDARRPSTTAPAVLSLRRGRPLPPRALRDLLQPRPAIAGPLRRGQGTGPGARPSPLPHLPGLGAARRPPPQTLEPAFLSDHPLPGLPRAPAPPRSDRPLGPRVALRPVGRAAPSLAAPAAAAGGSSPMSEEGTEGFEGKSEGKPLAPAAASPAPTALAALVLDGLTSPHSRRAYGRALEEFFAWYPSNASGEGFNRATVQRYRSHLTERELSAAARSTCSLPPYASSPPRPPRTAWSTLRSRPPSRASPEPAAPDSGAATG